MSDTFLHDLTYALGDHARSVDDSVAAGRTRSTAKVLRCAGFEKHHVAAAETTAYELARRAVEGVQDALVGISAIVYATCLPENANLARSGAFERSRDVKDLMDFPVSHLQCEFALHDAIAIGLNQQACTGMLGSVRLARALLSAEPDFERVLCISADRFPEGAIYEQAYNLISDGSAACIVSREPSGFRILACHQITNGALSRASDDESVGAYFSYTYRVVRETLEKGRVDVDDLAWIVPQNMNIKAWQILSRLLGFDFRRISFDTLPEAGHVISGDNVMNLKHLDATGCIEAGDRVLLVMAGYGMNWQCILTEKI